MSTLSVATIKSQSSSPPTIQNTSGTQVGTFCRAWVNFNGTGTVAIRASFNVSSITDNGTGNFTVNFTNAMADANYVVQTVSQLASSQANWSDQAQPDGYLTGSVKIYTGYYASSVNTARDHEYIHVAVFR